MLKGQYVGLRAIERGDLPQLLTWRNQPEYRRYFREYRELSSVNQAEWFESRVVHDRNTVMFAGYYRSYPCAGYRTDFFLIIQTLCSRP